MDGSSASAYPGWNQIGTMVLSLPDEVKKLPLRAAQDVDTLGLFNRIGAAIKHLIFGASCYKRLSNNMTRVGYSLHLKAVRDVEKQLKYKNC